MEDLLKGEQKCDIYLSVLILRYGQDQVIDRTRIFLSKDDVATVMGITVY